MFSQNPAHHINLLDTLDIPSMHNTKLNDIWGYTDEFGNEYALVGTENGVSIVDVTNPNNVFENFWVIDSNSTWRDIKTYGDYAYVTTEALAGILIINLTDLPNVAGISVSHFYGNNWLSAHNLFIDENGYLYIYGANRGNGGVIIYDLNTNPLLPQEVGTIDNWYTHDGYVLNDTAYLAHVLDGFFSIFDISDKSNPILLGTSPTPSTFTHNIWTTSDHNYTFTTDEVQGGYIASFDVSNPSMPVLLDKIQSSPGSDIIPHNVHVKGNLIFTSYYTDGLVVHDISRPNNMIMVGSFDTSPIQTGTFNGCWGVYPFFNSGIIIASDLEEGLFILNGNFNSPSYLEGVVTDSDDGSPLSNVSVKIEESLTIEETNLFGSYATGIDSSGLINVTYSKLNYYPKTLSVNVQAGTITQKNVELEKLPIFNLTVNVYDEETKLPIENAMVQLKNVVENVGQTNSNGAVNFIIAYPGSHQVNVGKWGYITKCVNRLNLDSNTVELNFELEKGFYDDFAFDFGWFNSYTGEGTGWERTPPIKKGDEPHVEAPATDFLYDCNDYCYITGLNNSVENGSASLFSPIFNFETIETPHINYALWYFDYWGPQTPDDTLFVYLMDGTKQILIDALNPSQTHLMSNWILRSIPIQFELDNPSSLILKLSISDFPTSDNIVEAGFDYFSVTNYSLDSIDSKPMPDTINAQIYPNPVHDLLHFNIQQYSVKVFDLQGKLVDEAANVNMINLSHLSNGFYIVNFKLKEESETISKKIIKL